jgi:tRNA-specific 2-thiouridylase
VRDGDYADFIEKYTGKIFPEGDFVDTSGNILGRHKGIIRYTIGQRRGLGLALKEPMYVLDKNVENNTVILCRDAELYAKNLTAYDINLIPFDRIENKIRIKAEQPAVAEQTGEDILRVEFETPQRAITKGQSVVLYDGDIVVGGGTIA